jgi:hypothetical protein
LLKPKRGLEPPKMAVYRTAALPLSDFGITTKLTSGFEPPNTNFADWRVRPDFAM